MKKTLFEQLLEYNYQMGYYEFKKNADSIELNRRRIAETRDQLKEIKGYHPTIIRYEYTAYDDGFMDASNGEEPTNFNLDDYEEAFPGMMICPKCEGSGEIILVLDEGNRVSARNCDRCGGAGVIGVNGVTLF